MDSTKNIRIQWEYCFLDKVKSKAVLIKLQWKESFHNIYSLTTQFYSPSHLSAIYMF